MLSFAGGSVVKNTLAKAGDVGSILGHEDPLKKKIATHSSILKNPMDRGAWWVIFHRVAEELDTT